MMATAELVVPVDGHVSGSSSSDEKLIHKLGKLTQIDTDHGTLHLALRLGRLIAGKPRTEGRTGERSGARSYRSSPRELMARWC